MVDSQKKDLTSLVELSNLEMEKKPPEPTSPAIPEAATDINSKTLESEFAALDTLTIPETTSTTETNTPSLSLEPEITLPTETLDADIQEPSLASTLEKRIIEKPRVEASPAFSLLALGKFTQKAKKIIEDAVGSEDYGISVQDISVQLKSGKFFVPQISEFAAITLAQKIRDVVDSIEIGLAEEIFKSSAAELAPEQAFMIEEQSQKEAHDLETEPMSEADVFSSNLIELQGFKITRVLSTLTISEILSKEIAESPASKKFETVTQRLTKELISRAFKLRANGVMGINFSLHPIQKGYRILATGTAVKGKRTSADAEPA